MKMLRKDDPHWLDPAGNVSLSIKDWAKFVIAHMVSDQAPQSIFLKSEAMQKLHTPPDHLDWSYDEEYLEFWNKECGWPLQSADYALGWFVNNAVSDNACLHHSGTSQGFQAEVYLSTKSRCAIVLATNARMGHIHLYRTAMAINDIYALNIDMPKN